MSHQNNVNKRPSDTWLVIPWGDREKWKSFSLPFSSRMYFWVKSCLTTMWLLSAFSRHFGPRGFFGQRAADLPPHLRGLLRLHQLRAPQRRRAAQQPIPGLLYWFIIIFFIVFHALICFLSTNSSPGPRSTSSGPRFPPCRPSPSECTQIVVINYLKGLGFTPA